MEDPENKLGSPYFYQGNAEYVFQDRVGLWWHKPFADKHPWNKCVNTNPWNKPERTTPNENKITAKKVLNYHKSDYMKFEVIPHMWRKAAKNGDLFNLEWDLDMDDENPYLRQV